MKAILIICLFAAISTAVGCRVGSDYCGPTTVPLGQVWREPPDPTIRVDRDALSGWWFGFQDPVLDGLIEQIKVRLGKLF